MRNKFNGTQKSNILREDSLGTPKKESTFRIGKHLNLRGRQQSKKITNSLRNGNNSGSFKHQTPSSTMRMDERRQSGSYTVNSSDSESNN
jgi:hypothetical protein